METTTTIKMQNTGFKQQYEAGTHPSAPLLNQDMGEGGGQFAHKNTLEKYPTLVLNADYRPLSYYPLSIWNWQDAVKAAFMDRVNIVEEYDFEINSPSFKMRLPSVVGLKSYVKASREPTFTRFNVFLRDSFSCQYCGSPDDLTFDHVIPRYAGGQTTWDNILTACSSCNVKKGKLQLKDANMHPRQKPYKPDVYDLHNKGRKFPPSYLHESWMDYLYWDAELAP